MKNKKNIKQCIQDKGIKIGFVAKEVGYSQGYFKRKLDTPEELTLKEAEVIARVLNESIVDLDFGIDL